MLPLIKKWNSITDAEKREGAKKSLPKKKKEEEATKQAATLEGWALDEILEDIII